MPEYEPNESKPEKILTGYGTVRGAELKVIYQDIGESTLLTDIERRYGRPREGGYQTDHIHECLRFLQTLDMIKLTDEETLKLINTPLFTEFDLPFELRLLYHIRQQTGEQYHLAAIHDTAIMELVGDEGHYGNRRVTVGELVTEVKRHTDYDLTWREEKITMWANLLALVGVLSYSAEEDEIVLAPHRAPLHDLLTLHNEHRQEHRQDGDGLLAALEWIHESFFPVFTRRGDPTVHVGVADVMENMVTDGAISLKGMSDRTEVVNLPMVIDDTQTPADFDVGPAPKRPSYWYPLEMRETRLKA